MLTVEFRVNGAMIAQTYIVNRGTVLDDSKMCSYEFEHYRPGEGVLSKGVCVHDRNDGAEVLVRDVLSKVVESEARKLGRDRKA